MTVMVLSAAITHSTGPMRLNSAPMMISTMRSGRSMKPTLQLGMSDSARAGVAHTHPADHDASDHHHVEKTIGARVIHQQPKEQRHIAIAVNDGIEETAELRDLVGGAGHPAIHHIENAGAYDHQSGVEKHAALVLGVGIA